MSNNSDVEDNRRRHGGIPPRPWRVKIYTSNPNTVIAETDCWGIYAANGKCVVETDSGFYPPDIETAEFICKCVNEQHQQQYANITVTGDCGKLHSFEEWQKCPICDANLRRRLERKEP